MGVRGVLCTSREQWLFCLAATLIVSFSLVLWDGRSLTQAQTFDSGSNGSDGALNFATPGTIIFDPQALGLDPDGDNVYHFTSITIGAGVTVLMSATYINGSVFWLASGPVQIDGTIDLSGENGHPENLTIMSRHAPVPGPGGYTGGLGGNSRASVRLPPLPGSGPGGGSVSINGPGQAGRNLSNSFLVPLIGGAGGAGGDASNTLGGIGGGGGAGGGAILIASSVSITINGNGAIRARGGRGGVAPTLNRPGGSGAGGSIRLAAPVLSGNGVLDVSGAGDGNSAGFIRLEDFQRSSSIQTSSAHGHGFIASPFAVFLNPAPSPAPSVRVVSVAGMPVPPNPLGGITMPDVIIDQAAAVIVEIEANNIPPGTVVQLHVFSEANNGTGQIVNSAPLVGTMQRSTATASVTIPPGFSQGFVRATWTP